MPIDRNITKGFGAMPSYLRHVAMGIPTHSQAERPKAGGFSLVEHACHLRDYEVEGIQLRITRILREVEPLLVDFPGDRLAVERRYNDQVFGEALGDFDRARNETLRILSVLSDEQLERKAVFGSEGRTTLRRMIEIFAEHDATHRRELDELTAELSTGGLRSA